MNTMDEVFRQMELILDLTLIATEEDSGSSTVLEATEDGGVPGDPKIEVTAETTQDAALRFRGQKVAILNFASGVMPGGGVRYGATAQEENLCMCSGLLHQLEAQIPFYEANRAPEAPEECYDRMIWSEGVPMVRDGSFQEVPPMKMQVITYPAPISTRRVYQGGGFYGYEDNQQDALKAIFERRTRHIVNQAAQAGTEVLILGAWGCGAYGNDPEMVARCFRSAIETHSGSISRVVFAVYGNPVSNRQAFELVFIDKLIDSWE